MMMGTFEPARRRLATSTPLRSGSATSSSTVSGAGWLRATVSASAPVDANSTTYPSWRKMNASDSACSGSSSTTTTRPEAVAVSCPSLIEHDLIYAAYRLPLTQASPFRSTRQAVTKRYVRRPFVQRVRGGVELWVWVHFNRDI